MTDLQGVLLDIDGTLLLSNEAHARAWVDAYAELGYTVALEKIVPLIGMGGDRLMKTLTPELDEGEGKGQEIKQRRQDIFLARYAPSLCASPGSRELVLRMKEEGLTLTVATSAHDRELQALLEAAQVEDLVHETTTSNEADRSKPAPDIVQVALEKSKQRPDQVVMLGDTPYDVESAGRAGVGVIALRCGGHGDDELADALAIYDDPADLLAHYDESPIGRRTTGVSAVSE